jgi:hypothetical protein
MTSRTSKLVLTGHITFSIGWLGAVAVFLALAIAGITSVDTQLARASYLAMELSAWFVIVPFCFASLITGLVQAIGTKWGLFRHYWIVVKLVLTIAATLLLLLHIKPIGYMAEAAANPSFSAADQGSLRVQLVADAGAALLLLLAITTISVYKPWGRIKYKVSAGNERRENTHALYLPGKRSFGFYLLLAFACLLLFIIIKHLFGGGMGDH